MRYIVMFFILIGVVGCATKAPVATAPALPRDHDANIVIFIDGTRNNLASNTNVGALYRMMKSQNRTDIKEQYIEGVGTGARVIGAYSAWGLGKDVRQAYQFLAENHQRSGDKVFLFGFSRGAFSTRVLAGFIYWAGVPDISGMTEDERKRFVRRLYNAYTVHLKEKEDGAPDYTRQEAQRRRDIAAIYANSGVTKKENVKINFFGAWDAVGATGLPDFEERTNEVEERYADQICNIDEAFHAVALDDNRERLYTPVLMTFPHMNRNCDTDDINEKVTEVWFSGAHSDVGGNYDDGLLRGVSMNWMIAQMKGKGVGGRDLLSANVCVSENPLDIIHDAEGASPWFKATIKRQSRDLGRYLDKSDYNNKKAKVHRSVVERFRLLTDKVEDATVNSVKKAQSRGKNLALLNAAKIINESTWYNSLEQDGCLTSLPTGFELDASCVCIVDNNSNQCP